MLIPVIKKLLLQQSNCVQPSGLVKIFDKKLLLECETSMWKNNDNVLDRIICFDEKFTFINMHYYTYLFKSVAYVSGLGFLLNTKSKLS